MKNRLVNTEPDRVEEYGGLTIHARAGVHAELEQLVRRTIPAGSTVVDVGAGAGAFSARLGRAGYRVTACDIDAAKWAAPDVPFVQVDVAESLAEQVPGPFDAACCIEVIEHVENPWQLFRQLAAVVRPGGRLVLSTPNTTSFLSRLTFLQHGRFHQFGDSDLEYGHINPLTAFEVRLIAGRTGWTLLEEVPVGYLPIVDLQRKTGRALAYGAARAVAYATSGPGKHGWCRAFTFERDQGGHGGG